MAHKPKIKQPGVHATHVGEPGGVMGEVPSVTYEDDPAPTATEVIEATQPSCMNGCPHFWPAPEETGKYLGFCRRFPPVPLANTRWHAMHPPINHPVKGMPDPPICGEHPTFGYEKRKK